MTVIDYFIGGFYKYHYSKGGEQSLSGGTKSVYFLTFIMMWNASFFYLRFYICIVYTFSIPINLTKRILTV